MNRRRAAMGVAFLCLSLNLCAQPQTQQGSDDGFPPQPTDFINERLPKWVQLVGSFRLRYEDQDGIGLTSESDTHLLTQLWVGVKVQPTTWLSFFGEAQDSEMFYNGVLAGKSPYKDAWDLHQAWVQIGNATTPVAVEVGRQELNFGAQRLIGAAPWLNAPRVFDAALTTFRFLDVQVDAFASSVVNSVLGQPDEIKPGNPLYGLYGTLAHLIPNSSLEPYFFWRLAPTGYGAAYADGVKGHLDEKTFGFRWSGKLPSHFDYDVEMARQYGNIGADGISAWAGHWNAGRTFDVALKPRVFVESNYASGNSNPSGTTVGTFDQLYPSGHDKFGETDQVGWRNIVDFKTGAELNLIKKVAFVGSYFNFWLANAHDGLYAATGAVVAKSLTGAAGTHVGQEVDAEALYKWNKAVQFGLGYGHLFTGEFLDKTTPGKSYNYPYVMMTYKF